MAKPTARQGRSEACGRRAAATQCRAGTDLAELPQRGPHIEHSASNTGQPLNEAAFDPNDREMLRRIDTPQPKPADPAGYADGDLDDVTLYDDTDADDDMYPARR